MIRESPRDAPAGEYLDEIVTRFRRLAVGILILLTLVLAGYWRLQVLQAGRYRELAENNRLRQTPIRANRGAIFDVEQRALVENVAGYNLFLDRRLCEEIDGCLAHAAQILEGDPEDLREVVEAATSPTFQPVLIAEELSLSQVARFEVTSLEHPEFLIRAVQRRLYRHGEQTSHVLGYLSEATEDDLRAGDLRSGDLVGREGFEQHYDAQLRGEDGDRILVVDSRGRAIEELTGVAPETGTDFALTLDLDLQQEAVEMLDGHVGAIVAIDPRDGAVRAMASSPSYDPNVFTRRLDNATWRKIVDSEHQPLQNRAIHNQYPPGSIFKIVVSLVALERGVHPHETVFCAGSKRYFERARRCWLRGGHGAVDLHDAIKYSCDIYFYEKGLKLGIEAIAEMARRLGLGALTGIDLPGEREGLVPDGAWSERVRESRWYSGETISVSIGQGPILTTPLQVAVLVAAVANGGRLVTPHLVVGEEREARAIPGLDPDDLARVAEALRAVVQDEGSGSRARTGIVTIAGKTGTAQVVEQRQWTRAEDMIYEQRDHAWFGSYAPFEDSELVVVVFVEHGGLGSRIAAPLAKRLHEKYFE